MSDESKPKTLLGYPIVWMDDSPPMPDITFREMTYEDAREILRAEVEGRRKLADEEGATSPAS